MASRDRRTKAQLLRELEEWKRNAHKALDALRQEKVKWEDLAARQNECISSMEDEIEAHKSAADTYEQERDAFQKELEKVQRELSDRKERDSSPRRLSAATSRSRMEQTCKFTALGHVLAWERDAVIDEQKATINKLMQEIEALRKGEGPIGEIIFRLRGNDVDDWTKERLLAQKTPVYETLQKMERLMDASLELVRWGHVEWYHNLSNIPDRRPH